MFGKISMASACAVIFALCVARTARTQTGDLLPQLRAQTPQSIIDLAKETGDGNGNPANIEIVFDHADLDGTGKADFVVAAYLTVVDGTLRVFRENAGQLQVVADLDPEIEVGGGNFNLEIIDIDNDGKPEIVAKGSGTNVDYTLDIFKWTSSSLVEITPAGVDTTDAELFDVDHDGMMEIVTPPDCTGLRPEQRDPAAGKCKGDYKVYKFNGSEFALAFTSPTDPTGRSAGAASGVLIALPRHAVMHPDSFPLAAVAQAAQGQSSQGGVVTVRIGNLLALVAGGAPQPLDVNDIDAASLVLGRNIRPLSTQVIPPSSTDTTSGSENSATPLLQAQFDRQTVLAFLPKVQLNKPLEVGDSLALTITGKMKNGVPLQAGVTVKIVAD